LFGQWSIADAMFLPVVFRFITYGITVSDEAKAYMDFVFQDKDVQRWIKDALAESEIIELDEAGEEV
jgi:glutathione S-transferase